MSMSAEGDPEKTKVQLTRARDASARAVGWIGSADTKATAMLTIAGAVLAIVSGYGVGKTQWADWRFYLMLGFVLGMIGTTALAALALTPRLNRVALLKCGGLTEKDREAKSTLFFGDLGLLKATEFFEAMKTPATDRDELEQAYIVAVIARRKMILVRLSMWLLVIGLACLAAHICTIPCGG
jgi:MFS family permease